MASRVVESLFVNFSPKDTAMLKQEFYGPHFSLFSGDVKGVPTLKSILESAKTENQKESAMKFVKEIVTKGVSKSFFGYTFFQALLAELIDVSEPGDIQELAPSLADHSIHLLSTRAGARCVAAIASYGTPKDRKRICKSLKGYTASSLLHRDAYLALIRLVQVTDDTVSIHKSILNEILTSQKGNEEEEGEQVLVQLASSDTASKFLLFLLAPDTESRMKYFDPYERSVLEPVPEIKGVCTYKKESSVRREELLKYMKEKLVDMCHENAGDLIDTVPGSRVLKEVYNNFGTEELVDAIMQICTADAKKEISDEEELSVFEDPMGHRAIKNLIVCDSTRDDPIFARAFFEQLRGDLMKVAASNRGAFIVAALFNVESIRPKLVNVLKSQRKLLKILSSKGKANAGYKALLKELSPS